jgi:hypothetical protein
MKKGILFGISVFIFFLIPSIAKADCGEGIPDFMCFFLEPLFLEVIIGIMIAGFVGYVSHSGLGFAVTLGVVILVLALSEAFPIWLFVIFALIVGAIVFLMKEKKE